MASGLIEDKTDVKFAKLLFNKGTDDALSFNCLIKDIEKDFVNFIGISDYSEQVETGAPVDIRIYSVNGVVNAQATLLKIFKLGNHPLYTTSYPVVYDHTQKRAYYRADIHLPVTLLIVQHNGVMKKIQATTKNISGRGMCFVSLEEEFPQYHSISVNLRFPDRYIIATANFVCTTPVLYKNKTLYIHSFKFTGIEPRDINFIVKECFLFQINKNQKKKIR